jgi:ferredoxin
MDGPAPDGRRQRRFAGALGLPHRRHPADLAGWLPARLAPGPVASHHGPSPVSDAPIKKVWIEAGCISCKLCQDIVPQVFLVDDDKDCVVKPDAAQHFGGKAEDIEQAKRDCPVEVIQVERG